MKIPDQRRICLQWMAIIAFSFSTVNCFSQLPFQDGFESGDFVTGGWTPSGAAAISIQSPSHGIYCVEGPSTWGIVKTINSIAVNTLMVEFDVKASQDNTTCLIFRIKDNGNGTSAGVIFDYLGFIIGVNGTGSHSMVPLMPYIPNTWYSFLLILDMSSNTYDIYIDNILIGDDFNFFSTGFTDPYLFTWNSLATSGTAWIDGVSIYGEATGFSEMNAGDPSLVHPNPVSDFINIGSGIKPGSKLEVFNSSGMLVKSMIMNREQNSIEAAQLSNGIYYMMVTDQAGNLLYGQKFMKE